MDFGFFYTEMEARCMFFLLFILAGASEQRLTLSVFCKTKNSQNLPIHECRTDEEAVAPHCLLDVVAHLLALEGSAVTLHSARAP